MELVAIKTKLREETGKGAARRLRRTKQIPAVLYGPKTEPVSLSLDAIEFDRVIRENGTSGLFFDLKIEGEAGKNKIAMLKEWQTDIYGLDYLHVDFHEIDLDTQVSVTVPVEVIGECRGVKEGGMLQIIRRELDIICKPADTPETIQIDATNLEMGDSVHVEELDLGGKIEIPHEVNFTILTVAMPSAAEEEEAVEEGEEEEAAAAATEDAENPEE